MLSESDIDAAYQALPPEKRAEVDRLAASINVGSLMEFIPRVTPRIGSLGTLPPLHLLPLVRELERSRHEPIEIAVSMPPQHCKTVTVAHALVWRMLQDSNRHGYASYSSERGEEVSLDMQDIATRARLPWSGSRASWQTPWGGSLIATGAGGGITGKPIDGLFVYDDSIKNAEDARSLAHRDAAWRTLETTIRPRLHPSASLVLMGTRWHEDDVIGRAVKQGMRCINIPAISGPVGDEKALWEERRPLKWLIQEKRDKMSPKEWLALYQGQPRADDAHMFGTPQTYERAPNIRRYAIGIDAAYSSKTSADYSVAVVMSLGEDGYWYLENVVRGQMPAPMFLYECLKLQGLYPSAAVRWYGGGTEKGTADFFINAGMRLDFRPTGAVNKMGRAIPVSTEWNAGRVLVPSSNPPWLAPVLEETAMFSGVNDKHDDIVDALAAAFDALPGRPVRQGPPIDPARAESEKLFEYALRQNRRAIKERQCR